MGATSIQAKPTTDIDHIIAQVTLFDGMSENELEGLKSIMEYRVIGKYSYIYHQGEKADHLYLLANGSVKIGTLHNDGREMIKRILHPEAVFGEVGLFSNECHNNFALTLNTEVIFYKIAVDNFRQLMRHSSQLHFNVLSMIGRRLTNTEKRLESLIFKDARARIIDFLRFNAETRGRKVGFETFFKHNLTQQDIANFTGTSRQTVTSVLNELRKSNQIYFNRTGILIRDLANLA